MFKCPNCVATQSRANEIKSILTLRRWSVEELVIHSVTITGATEKGAYARIAKGDPRRTDLPRVESALVFAKKGNGEPRIMKFVTIPFYVDPDDEKIDDAIRHGYAGDVARFVFHSKADAEKAMRKQMAADVATLTKYNEEHGTSHEYPFA